MRRSGVRSLCVLMACAAGGGLAGCNNSSAMIESFDSEAAVDVQAGMQVMVLSAPSADSLAELIVTMMAEGCEEAFDLVNGVTGTCSITGGEMTFTFDGAMNGTLAARHAAGQPEAGVAYDIDVSAANGDATWRSSGSVTLDQAGDGVDLMLALSGTIAPSAGAVATVTVTIDAGQLELLAIGPRGGVLHFALDRTTMAGVMTLNGTRVAAVSILNGCAVLDPVVSELESRTACP